MPKQVVFIYNTASKYPGYFSIKENIKYIDRLNRLVIYKNNKNIKSLHA